ncbi:M23 family metallopeptidase [Aquimarina brevivitae]|uniref:LysM domain-containing protein n=1 Tax=Aquimarina brevivitae TaxID=323412 RepID=A0A4Q7P1Q0_9FLAO|nr:M23 family metallopeptidase [Aquimarina brevivitae]RZS93783.1 LysM domain-containing protein [Aquimarina brevivitae]
MIRIKVLIVLSLLPFCSFSQSTLNYADDNFIGFTTITTSDGLLQLPIFKGCNCDNLTLASALDESDAEEVLGDMTGFWETDRFNPFTEEVNYPFVLQFQTDSFAAPVNKKMHVTSRYGWRRGRPHRGIDIDLVTGDDVKSILSGKVRYVGYTSGFGNTVVVRHYNGLETVYAHLSSFTVSVNQEIEKGHIIGKGGVSGNARGSHLHLEVRYYGNTINPEYLFDFSESSKIHANSIYVTEKWTSPRYHRSTRQSKIEVCTTLQEAEKFTPAKNEIYVVKKGDTLYRIANKYGVKITQLCKKNAIKHSTPLRIGQRLVVF